MNCLGGENLNNFSTNIRVDIFNYQKSGSYQQHSDVEKKWARKTLSCPIPVTIYNLRSINKVSKWLLNWSEKEPPCFNLHCNKDNTKRTITTTTSRLYARPAFTEPTQTIEHRSLPADSHVTLLLNNTVGFNWHDGSKRFKLLLKQFSVTFPAWL